MARGRHRPASRPRRSRRRPVRRARRRTRRSTTRDRRSRRLSPADAGEKRRGHRPCRAFREDAGLRDADVRDVPERVDALEAGLERPRLDRHEAVDRHAALEHDGGRSMLRDAEEQVVRKLGSVVEDRDPPLRATEATRFSVTSSIPRSRNASTRATEVSGDGGTGRPNGVTTVISQASRTPFRRGKRGAGALPRSARAGTCRARRRSRRSRDHARRPTGLR